MAGVDEKEHVAEPEVETPKSDGKEVAPAAEDQGKQQAGTDAYGRITDLYAYQTLPRSAKVIAQAVKPVLDAAESAVKVLVLDDWNYLASSVVLKKAEAGLAFHTAKLSSSIQALSASMGDVPKGGMHSAAEQGNSDAEVSKPADIGGTIAHLQSLHTLLQPTIDYAARDIEFDADAVRAAVAGALAAPPATCEVFIPALRQLDPDTAKLPLFKTLQEAISLRDDLIKKLAEAREWIKKNLDSPQKPEVEKQTSAGDDILKTFDAYMGALLDVKSKVLEQALVHAAANNIGATHLLAVKPVLAVSQTTGVRAFPLMNENRHLGASVLAYTLATKDGRVCAAGVADAEKELAVQPHLANRLLVWLLGAVALLLALSLLFGAGTLSLAGFRALMTSANPPVTATVAPAATPSPTQMPVTTPQGAPGG
jgi:hypothetical protein